MKKINVLLALVLCVIAGIFSSEIESFFGEEEFGEEMVLIDSKFDFPFNKEENYEKMIATFTYRYNGEKTIEVLEEEFGYYNVNHASDYNGNYFISITVTSVHDVPLEPVTILPDTGRI